MNTPIQKYSKLYCCNSDPTMAGIPKTQTHRNISSPGCYKDTSSGGA